MFQKERLHFSEVEQHSLKRIIKKADEIAGFKIIEKYVYYYSLINFNVSIPFALEILTKYKPAFNSEVLISNVFPFTSYV